MWDLGGGNYLIDDLSFDYGAVSAAALAGVSPADDSGPPPPPAGGGGAGTTNSPGGAPLAQPLYTTNDLWLQITGTTNLGGVPAALLVVHAPWNWTNAVFDLQYTPGLTPASWQHVLRTEPGQTNLVAPNAFGPKGFYRLAPANDLQGPTSLGTDFWINFPMMYRAELYLYMAGPGAATGTVSFVSRPRAVSPFRSHQVG